MKKRLFSMLVASAFAMMSGAFVSCNDSDDVDAQNTLRVTPSEGIHCSADGFVIEDEETKETKENVVLTIETDAQAWSFEKSDWIIAVKEGNKLTVNAEANISESARPGRITIKAGNAEPVKIGVLQEGISDGEVVLSVTPSEAIEFEAKDNQPVVLTVTTNADEWTYTYPEAWMTASKEGDKLTVNAKNNTGEANVGQIVIKTGDGEKQVRIVVTQKAGSADDADKVAGVLSSDDELKIQFAHDATEPVTKTLTFTLEQAAAADVQVRIVLDAPHVEEVNFDQGTYYSVFPDELCTMPDEGVLTVPAGETSATIEVTITPNAEKVAYFTDYMLPLQAVAKSGNVAVEEGYVELLVSRKSSKQIRNICYFEVNDCNPLNALEYLLEDGQPFFDAVVLFAGNINYNTEKDRVYMNANPNVQALLDNSEELLQPLRRKGIKVLLDILGNHDRAGIAGLSDYGCQEFGRELAQICLDYKLDGVGFDDEYSSYSYTATDWFSAGPSSTQAARLLYETKKAMAELCPWETWVHLYYLGYISSSLPSVTVDGVTYQPGDFVDNVCADYGRSAAPVAGMDKSGCAGTSLQLNYSYTITSASAKSHMDNGYGWIMWFAFDPSGTGTVSSNRAHSLQQFRNVAEGCYGQSVLDPQNVYNKLGEGSYDPAPHPIN